MAQWTKESIVDLLMKNDKALVKALVRLYERQTKAEQASWSVRENNKKGFTKFDAPLLTSFSEQVINGRTLSPKQIEILRKRLPKYHKQLVEIANQNQG